MAPVASQESAPQVAVTTVAAAIDVFSVNDVQEDPANAMSTDCPFHARELELQFELSEAWHVADASKFEENIERRHRLRCKRTSTKELEIKQLF